MRQLASACILAAALTLPTTVSAQENQTQQNRSAQTQQTEAAIFAGGCFWCVESDFDKVPGVVATVSGYTGGRVENPTYKQVSAGGTGHREAVEITYDPSKVSYDELLSVFWRTVDPTDAGGQFCDRGESYETAIFALTPEQRAQAEASKAEAEKTLGKAIVTPIESASTFYPAEGYHQDYYTKNPLKYRYYRYSCGRDQRINALWQDEAFKGLEKG